MLWATVAAASAVYTAISTSRHVRRDPASWDPGILAEAMKQYAHGNLPAFLTSRHPGSSYRVVFAEDGVWRSAG